MSFHQDHRTLEFVKHIKKLVESAEEPTYKEIAKKLKWNNTALYLVMKGSRNVPNDVYKLYTEIYKSENLEPDSVDYRNKYISLLEKQIEEKNQTIEEQKAQLQNMQMRFARLEVNLGKLLQSAGVEPEPYISMAAELEPMRLFSDKTGGTGSHKTPSLENEQKGSVSKKGR
jgi:flagellar biosynthesis chaperone FliJ